MTWQHDQSNPFADDSEERGSGRNYRQIYKDLLEFRNMINALNDEGYLWPTPRNGKTWIEEQHEWFNKNINTSHDLIKEGKVKSCEIKSHCENMIRDLQGEKNKITRWTNIGEFIYDSSDHEINSGHSIDELIKLLEQHLKGNNQENELRKALDSLGNSACEPRALANDKSEGPLLAHLSKVDALISKPNTSRII